MNLQFIKKDLFEKVRNSQINKIEKLELLAKMNRFNTLYSIKRAGSGHIGSSFSAMDIVNYLYEDYMNVNTVGIDSNDRDIYFSSKGHDAPGLYAILYANKILNEEDLSSLRRLSGPDGHPDVRLNGVEANTGSLGMGISKARGMIYSKRYKDYKGRVIVMLGDGEFQEGQNFEALQSSVQQKENDLLVIMDHNKLQSDREIKNIVDLRDLKTKIESFGWWVHRCDGHNYQDIENAFLQAEKIKDKPRFIIFDTIKGKGVSFMEHPIALKDGKGYYKWHSGAPKDEFYTTAITELENSIQEDLKKNGLESLKLHPAPQRIENLPTPSSENIARAYGQTLVRLAEKNKNFVVLDADLSLDCQILDFEHKYPERFVEMGIAEQDMVSMACGIASNGIIPIVNSFATFLAARANEQTYNAQTEYRKIIYMNHFAGLFPAGPGKSHQSVRDISLYGALPNVTILQPCNAREMEQITQWAIEDSPESVMVRVNIGPSPDIISLPADYKIKMGEGVQLTEGSQYFLISYGPYMLLEALKTAELFQRSGQKIGVINMPWLNRFDKEYWKNTLKDAKGVFVLEDHSIVGGLGDNFQRFINKENIQKFCYGIFGVDEIPKCGTTQEVLKAHHLDAISLLESIQMEMKSARHP